MSLTSLDIPVHLAGDLSECKRLSGKQTRKQNKTKQNKTKQNKTKQNKTKQNKIKQNKQQQRKKLSVALNNITFPSPPVMEDRMSDVCLIEYFYHGDRTRGGRRQAAVGIPTLTCPPFQ